MPDSLSNLWNSIIYLQDSQEGILQLRRSVTGGITYARWAGLCWSSSREASYCESVREMCAALIAPTKRTLRYWDSTYLGRSNWTLHYLQCKWWRKAYVGMKKARLQHLGMTNQIWLIRWYLSNGCQPRIEFLIIFLVWWEWSAEKRWRGSFPC